MAHLLTNMHFSTLQSSTSARIVPLRDTVNSRRLIAQHASQTVHIGCRAAWLRTAVVAHAKARKGAKAKVAEPESDKDDDEVAEAPASKMKGGSKGARGSGQAVDAQKLEKEVKADADERMKKAVQVAADNFNTIRTGRANPAILDRVMVEAHGSLTQIRKLANVSVPDSSTLVIVPFDKATLKDLERAILESDLGMSPNVDGEKIRLVVPPLTQDRRKELCKAVSKHGEEAKVAVRNVRKDVMKKIDKAGDALAKDSRKGLEEAVQKLTDAHCKRVDDLAKSKSEEVMKL